MDDVLQPDVFGGEVSIWSARHVFGRMRDQQPRAYTERNIPTPVAARILGRDSSTVRQQLVAGRLAGTRTANGWRLSVRDLSDYIAGGRWREAGPRRPWTEAEIQELLSTGSCAGRSAMACKLKRLRMRRGA